MTEPIADHLIHDVTARGFRHMPSLADGRGGRVRALESSAADAPHIYLVVSQPTDLGDPDGERREATVHLPVATAWQLAEQLLHLAVNHYHGFPTPTEGDDGEAPAAP